MITTANYIVKAVTDGQVYIFTYDDLGDVWEALEEFWHEDYPESLIDRGGGLFPIDVMAMDGAKVIKTYEFTFNAGVFHAFFDKGWSASSPLPDKRYTLDQFAKDIERMPKESDIADLRQTIDRWSEFCYNHPPYDEVILWMVGGSKQHYLYQHFCSKFLHHCDRCQQDTAGAWYWFYRELDSQWADRLLQYVYNEWKRNK